MFKKIVLPMMLALAFVLCLSVEENAAYSAARIHAAACVSALDG